MHFPPSNVVERSTPRLRLRRPTAEDRDFVHRLHSDPGSYVQAPMLRHSSLGQSERLLSEWLAHWEAFGFGYWIATDPAGKPIGCTGVKTADLDGREVLNLYYRFKLSRHGSGLGREAAREAVVFATEWVSEWPVTAVIRPGNIASIRTADAAGLTQVGSTRHAQDLEDWDPSLVFEAPRFTVPDSPLSLHDELLDLWMRVNAAGGAVGFMGAVPRAEVAARLAPQLAAVQAGHAVLGILREATCHALLGFAFWELGQAQMSHVARLKRVMTDPDRSGHNLGRILIAAMHAAARNRGVEIARLSYRGGTGLGAFYQRCGYREVGRVPGGLRFGSDSRDDVEMATRLDGRPLA